jgi:hypothetical protein
MLGDTHRERERERERERGRERERERWRDWGLHITSLLLLFTSPLRLVESQLALQMVKGSTQRSGQKVVAAPKTAKATAPSLAKSASIKQASGVVNQSSGGLQVWSSLSVRFARLVERCFPVLTSLTCRF